MKSFKDCLRGYWLCAILAPLTVVAEVAMELLIPRVMARLIDDILKNDLPAVYHEELASTAVTDALCEQTGAKSLLLHSAHNLSAEDMQAGKTFLDVMYDNLESLREGLN